MTEFVFKGNKVELNQKVPLKIKERIYEQMEENGDWTNYEKKFDLYLWKRGKGHRPNLLFTEPSENLQPGEAELYIKPTDNWGLDIRGESVARNKAKLKDEEKTLDTISYTTDFPADKLDVESLLMNLSNNEVTELIDTYLLGAGAAEIDEDILYVLRPYILQHDQDKIHHKQAMPSNPHALIYTNPYVGKSTTFDKIGKKVDYATPAKVLGWSGAENSSQGGLDGLTQAYGIDELNESGRDEKFLTRGFLPLMRSGEYTAEQGQGVKTTTWSPLLFMSNPKESETSEDLVTRFRENLSKLSDNYGALGSRIGVIIYGDGFDTVTEGTGDWNKKNQAGKVVETILELAAEEYSEIVKMEETQHWLNKGFPDQYEKEIEERRNELKLQEVKKFWNEHLNASKHSRGHALRNACLDHISELVQDQYSIENILETAEEHFSRLIDLNRHSFRNICSMIDQDLLDGVVRKDIETLQPIYMRYFCYGVIAAVEDKDIETDQYQPLTTVRKPYLDHKDKIVGEDGAKQYRKFARIKDYVENSNQSARGAVKSRIGIDISEIEGEVMWKVADEDKFDQYPQVGVLDEPGVPEDENGTQSTPSSSSEDKESSSKDGEKKQSTQSTPGTQDSDHTFPPKTEPAKTLYNSLKNEEWFSKEDAKHCAPGIDNVKVEDALNSHPIFERDSDHKKKFRIKQREKAEVARDSA